MTRSYAAYRSTAAVSAPGERAGRTRPEPSGGTHHPRADRSRTRPVTHAPASATPAMGRNTAAKAAGRVPSAPAADVAVVLPPPRAAKAAPVTASRTTLERASEICSTEGDGEGEPDAAPVEGDGSCAARHGPCRPLPYPGQCEREREDDEDGDAEKDPPPAEVLRHGSRGEWADADGPTHPAAKAAMIAGRSRSG